MRPIDADALINEIKKDAEKAIEQDDKIGSFWLGYFIGSVINQPTIQPVATDTNVGDKISRHAAIDALKEHKVLFCDNTPDSFSKLSYGEKCRVDEIDSAIAILINLPPAQPERKKGYWKHINEEEERAKHNGQLLGWMPWYCSECGCGVGKHQTPFCPNCGADMR